MAMLDRSEKQKVITSSFITVLFGALLVFMGLLMNHATKLSNAAGSEQGSIGSIKLFELYKTPMSTGGYNAGMQLSYSGIGMLLCVALIIGVAITVVRLKLPSNR
jgi:hypothetical protein